MKALVCAFNQEKALVGAFSAIVKTDCETDGSFYSTNHGGVADNLWELQLLCNSFEFDKFTLDMTSLFRLMRLWNCGSTISVVDYLKLKHRNDKLFRTQWRCLVTVVNHWWWVAVTMSWQNLIHWSYCQEKCKMQHFLAMLHRSFAHCCLNYLKVLSKNVESWSTHCQSSLWHVVSMFGDTRLQTVSGLWTAETVSWPDAVS